LCFHVSLLWLDMHPAVWLGSRYDKQGKLT
jgi:hypothetical protein